MRFDLRFMTLVRILEPTEETIRSHSAIPFPSMVLYKEPSLEHCLL